MGRLRGDSRPRERREVRVEALEVQQRGAQRPFFGAVPRPPFFHPLLPPGVLQEREQPRRGPAGVPGREVRRHRLPVRDLGRAGGSEGGGSPANFRGLVLGCIEAKFCK